MFDLPYLKQLESFLDNFCVQLENDIMYGNDTYVRRLHDSNSMTSSLIRTYVPVANVTAGSWYLWRAFPKKIIIMIQKVDLPVSEWQKLMLSPARVAP